MDRRRLQELEVKALPGAQKITCTSNSYGGVHDVVGNCAAEIADLRGIIEAKHKQCLYERSRLERYIASVDDSLLRQIFTCRFVHCMSWVKVASKLGGSNTADGVRMMCSRYLKEKNA